MFYLEIGIKGKEFKAAVVYGPKHFRMLILLLIIHVFHRWALSDVGQVDCAFQDQLGIPMLGSSSCQFLM